MRKLQKTLDNGGSARIIKNDNHYYFCSRTVFEYRMANGRRMNYSLQRERILDVLRGTKSHPTAEWVYAETRKTLPNISLATVYRNLNRLAERGEIIKIEGAFLKDRYDADVTPHAHIVCEKCGAVRDCPIPEDLAERLSELSNGARYDLSFKEVCENCKNAR